MDTHQRIAQRVLAEHMAIADRLRLNPKAVLDYALGNVARWSRDFSPERRPDWIADWERLLTGPLDTLIAAMTADTKVSTHLRGTSPFVGLLTVEERVEILRKIDPEMARTMEIFASSCGQNIAPGSKVTDQ